jgi:L-fuculose-phosphate aldolase
VNELKNAVADYARRLHARGWVANHDGNVSARVDAGKYLCTPTATSKADITAESLLVVDEGGARVSGRGRPFSEIGLHLAIYRQRADVQAVVHAHPPTATGFAAAGLALDQPFLAEAVVSLGPSVPLVPFGAPGDGAVQQLTPFCAGYDAVLVAGNGVFAWGRDVAEAYLRLELVEHLAHIALVARQLGGARPLPASALPALLEARRKAGLGLAATTTTTTTPGVTIATLTPPPDGAMKADKKPVVVACAPPPPGATVEVYEKPRPDLATVIREEIARALRDR